MAHDASSGRVEWEHPIRSEHAGNSPKSANDSYGQNGSTAQRRYTTKAAVEALREKLTDRQWSCLRDIGRLGTATGRQLERLHYEATETGKRQARHDLAMLTSTRALQRLTRSIGGVRSGSRGYVYAVGVAGQRLLSPGKARYRPPWTPQPSYLRHALNVSDLYVQLRLAERAGLLELDAFDAEPRSWRSFAGPGGGMVTLKPDAYAALLLGEFEDRYFIEMDMATESGPRILSKAKTYIRYFQSGREQGASGVFPIVVWVTTTPERRDFIVRMLAKIGEPDRAIFVVVTRDDFINHITATEQINPPKEVNP